MADGVCPVPILLNGNSFRFVSLILNVDEIYSLWGEELKEITLINKADKNIEEVVFILLWYIIIYKTFNRSI